MHEPHNRLYDRWSISPTRRSWPWKTNSARKSLDTLYQNHTHTHTRTHNHSICQWGNWGSAVPAPVYGPRPLPFRTSLSRPPAFPPKVTTRSNRQDANTPLLPNTHQLHVNKPFPLDCKRASNYATSLFFSNTHMSSKNTAQRRYCGHCLHAPPDDSWCVRDSPMALLESHWDCLPTRFTTSPSTHLHQALPPVPTSEGPQKARGPEASSEDGLNTQQPHGRHSHGRVNGASQLSTDVRLVLSSCGEHTYTAAAARPVSNSPSVAPTVSSPDVM